MNDGRKSTDQEIQHIRVNNPDLLTAEITDNEMDRVQLQKGNHVS